MEHDYFEVEDPSSRHPLPLAASPTPTTARSLLRHGILFKRTDDGFVLLCELTEDGSSPRRQLPTDCSWTFAVETSDPYFWAYSDLPPARPSEQIFHFSNRNSLPLRLTKGDRVSASDLLPVHPALFTVDLAQRFGFSPTGPDPLVRILGPRNEVVYEKTVASIEDTRLLHVDLRRLEPGPYLLEAETPSSPKRELPFFLDPRLAARPPLAVVSLTTAAGVDPTNRLVDDDGVPSSPHPVFSVAFGSRPAIWRYHVVPRHRTISNHHKLTVTSTLLPMEFGYGEPTTQPGIGPVITIASTTAVPLRHEYVPPSARGESQSRRSIKLSYHWAEPTGDDFSFDVDPLPVPDRRSLRFEPTEAEPPPPPYADTFVYV